MQVAGHDAGIDVQDAFQVVDGPPEECLADRIFKVPDMLAQKCRFFSRQADAVFQFGPAGQDLRGGAPEKNRGRHVPAGTPQEPRPAAVKSGNGIVAALIDLTVVCQKKIGDAGQSLESLVISDSDGFLAEVAAGHHQRAAELVQKQMMQRRVGKHHAKKTVAWGDRIGHRCLRPPRRQQDRPAPVHEQPLFIGGESQETPRLIQVGQHQGQGLFIAMLALAQSQHGFFISRVHREMKPAQSLDCENAAFGEQFRGLGDSVVRCPRLASRSSDRRRDSR